MPWLCPRFGSRYFSQKEPHHGQEYCWRLRKRSARKIRMRLLMRFRARKCLAQTSLEFQANILDDAAEKYLEIGDEDDADKTIREAGQVAEKTYAKDNDADDPNRVFKGAWPSANEWRWRVELSARFSRTGRRQSSRESGIKKLRPSKRFTSRVLLIGVPSSPMTVAISTKGGTKVRKLLTAACSPDWAVASYCSLSGNQRISGSANR